MITENDVVSAVCRHLAEQGYSIEQALTTNEKGIDVIARRPADGHIVLVEAKGGTSSKASSARHGKEFTPQQVFSHVAKAFFAAARLLPDPSAGNARVVVALPDTPPHRKHAAEVRRALQRLEISVWLVTFDGHVVEFVE